MREVFVREAARGVVRPIEIGEVALAAGLHHQLADPEIVQRLPDSGLYRSA
jgi:hypothetical protein